MGLAACEGKTHKCMQDETGELKPPHNDGSRDLTVIVLGGDGVTANHCLRPLHAH